MNKKKTSFKVGDKVALTLLFQGPRMETRPATVCAVSGDLFDVEDAAGKIWPKLVELSEDSPDRAVGIRAAAAPPETPKKKKKKKTEPTSTPEPASAAPGTKLDGAGRVHLS